jgi:cytochrome c553
MAMPEQRTMQVTPSEGRPRRIVNAGLPLALLSAILAIGFAATARAEATPAAAVSPQQVQAKMQYCEVCHGVDARGFPGYYPIPRLAGQQPEYIENQLKGFVENKRKFNVMNQVSHSLSPAMVTALATNFSKLNPKPLGGAPAGLADAGKKIFAEGVPTADVAPCASCHGADAKGNGQFPRLAGQLYPYVVRQLTIWSTERAEENSSIMAPIARSLTPQQIKDVAAYVSSLD